MRPRTAQATFDRVADRYDTLNALLSLGADRRWRRRAARYLAPASGGRILDVATGTGAFARAVRATDPAARCFGFDVNLRMLLAGRRRTARHGGAMPLVCATADAIPFADASFEAAGLAFALDDMRDPEIVLREVRRVLAPRGRLVLLELSLPSSPAVAGLYRLLLRLLPVAERLAGTPSTLSHLRREILGYRGAAATRARIEAARFGGHLARALSLGLATLHRAEKPIDAAPAEVAAGAARRGRRTLPTARPRTEPAPVPDASQPSSLG